MHGPTLNKTSMYISHRIMWLFALHKNMYDFFLLGKGIMCTLRVYKMPRGSFPPSGQCRRVHHYYIAKMYANRWRAFILYTHNFYIHWDTSSFFDALQPHAFPFDFFFLLLLRSSFVFTLCSVYVLSMQFRSFASRSKFLTVMGIIKDFLVIFVNFTLFFFRYTNVQ